MMKKLFCLLIAFILIPCVCFADFVTVQVNDEIISGKTGETVDSQLIDMEWTDGDEITVCSHIDTTNGEYTLKRVIVNGELAASSNQVVLSYANYQGIPMITVEFMYKRNEILPIITDEPPTITDEPPTETDPPTETVTDPPEEPVETIETDKPIETNPSVEITDAPVTDPPEQEPVQEIETTIAPTENTIVEVEITTAPVTNAPVTDPPVTDSPITNPPITDPPITDSPATDVPIAEPNAGESVIYFVDDLIIEEITETPTPAPTKGKKKNKKTTPTPKPKKTPKPSIKQYNVGILDKNLDIILDPIDISKFGKQKTLIWVEQAGFYISIELR